MKIGHLMSKSTLKRRKKKISEFRIVINSCGGISFPKLHFFLGFITLLTGLILDNVVWAIVKNEMVKLQGSHSTILCVSPMRNRHIGSYCRSYRYILEKTYANSGVSQWLIKTTEKCSFEASTFFEKIFSNKVRREEIFSKKHCF